jgi:peptidoglycan/LPS O-acetylase OafA/YrhL
MILLAHLPVLKNDFFSRWLNSVPAILRFGYLGVDIFFALSGFLITRILIYEKQQNQLSFNRFYLRRALRIFPAYYLCLLFSGLFISSDQLLPVAFYYNNYYSAFHDENAAMAHTWTLCVEEHFYFLWPILIYFIGTKKAKMLISFIIPLLAIMSGIALFFIFKKSEAVELLYKSSNTRMFTLAIGSYLAFRETAIKNLKTPVIALYSVMTIVLYISCILLTPTQSAAVKIWMHLLLLAPVSLLTVVLVIKLDGIKLKISKVFTNPAISYVGKISYGLYLFHMPVYFLLRSTRGQARHTEISYAAIAVISIFIVATCSYYLIERPFLKLKQKFTV